MKVYGGVDIKNHVTREVHIFFLGFSYETHIGSTKYNLNLGWDGTKNSSLYYNKKGALRNVTQVLMGAVFAVALATENGHEIWNVRLVRQR
jgi:hypothetical protein